MSRNLVFKIFLSILFLIVDVKSDLNSAAVDYWCPAGYSRYKAAGKIFERCDPIPCRWVNNNVNVNTSQNSGENETFDVVYSNETLSRICTTDKKFNATLKSPSCRRVVLSADKFTENFTDGSIYEIATNTTYQLGQYVYQPSTDEVWVCRDEILPADDTESAVFSCTIHKPNLGDYQKLENGSLYLPHINRIVRRGYYHQVQVGDQEIIDEICLFMTRQTESCEFRTAIEGEHIVKVNPDLSLFTDFVEEVLYPLGDYSLSVDGSLVVVCVDAGTVRREETRILYGAAFIVSAVFTFITLLVHLIYPKLNYHAKALFCHILSLFIMYIVMSVKSFHFDYPNDVSRLFMFGFHYVFALSTFFWLNVLAYELWRVFANISGAPGTMISESNKKRWFIAKCCYAWGIPLLLCILSIVLAYQPASAKFLDMTLQNEGTTWFESSKSLFALFYGPIIIILVENIIFFVLTIHNIRKTSKGTKILNKKISRKLLRVFVKLFIVMGMFWFAEVISWSLSHQTDEAFWYFTDLLNALQGVFIFLVYVCKRSTWRMLKKWWKGEEDVSNNTKSTTSSANTKGRKISTITMTEVTTTNIRPINN